MREIQKLISVLTVSLLVITGCDEKEQQLSDLNHRINSENGIFEIVYNPSFARRFELNEQLARNLDPGLFAVAAEINRVNSKYQCLFHFYIDSDLAIYKPQIAENFSAKTEAEYRFIRNYNDDDLTWNANRQDENTLRVLFRSKSLDKTKDGIISTLRYDRIKKDFLPGLTLVTINPVCGLFDEVDFPAQVWFQKSAYTDYFLGNDDFANPDRGRNQIFTIPNELVRKIIPLHEVISDYEYQME